MMSDCVGWYDRYVPITMSQQHPVCFYTRIVSQLRASITSYNYMLAVLVYRCLHGLAPGYLADEFTRVSEIVSRRNLRSASTANLVVSRSSRFQRKTLGGRAFPVAAAQAWNSLPSHVTSSSSFASFKRSLKIELFLRSYVEAWYRLMLNVTFLLRALEVNIDLRHVNHIYSLLLIIINYTQLSHEWCMVCQSQS